jgi:exodeoxyribonuclease VII large subunit
MVFGTVSVYERDGVYQIYVKAMRQDGIGDLHAEFEKLKAKLELEGLFDNSHKKKIPFMPKCIGVLTSNTGAVIRDIINVSTRRNKNVYIRLLPVPVQGKGAENKIAEAIKIMNDNNLCDVMILARGGGSLEDLWPFNEEIVARAIYDSKIPIISAVGHETDFTIADFVADLRAPTPSAAAELAVADVNEVYNTILDYKNRLRISLGKKLEISKLRYEKCMASKVYTDPLQKINEKYMLLDMDIKKMENSIKNILKDKKTYLVENISKLDALSPLKTLSRGYSIVESDNGKIINSSKSLKKGDSIKLKFSDGENNAIIS